MTSEIIVYSNSANFDIKVYGNTELKQILGSMKTLVNDATFKVNEEGLTFRGMDMHHVALINVKMFNTSFEKWDVKTPGLLSVRVEELYKIVKGLDKKDTIQLTFNDDVLTISTRQSKTQLKTLDHSNTDIPVPKIPYNTTITLSFNDFIKALKQIEIISEYVTFEADSNFFKVSGKGDNGSNERTFERGMDEISDLRTVEKSTSKYSLEYLMPFLRAVKPGVITVQYSTAKPLKLTVKLDNNSIIEFYLAPRVES